MFVSGRDDVPGTLEESAPRRSDGDEVARPRHARGPIRATGLPEDRRREHRSDEPRDLSRRFLALRRHDRRRSLRKRRRGRTLDADREQRSDPFRRSITTGTCCPFRRDRTRTGAAGDRRQPDRRAARSSTSPTSSRARSARARWPILGADVVHVESPSRDPGDRHRATYAHRNKRSIALDLKSEAGHAVATRLATRRRRDRRELQRRRDAPPQARLRNAERRQPALDLHQPLGLRAYRSAQLVDQHEHEPAGLYRAHADDRRRGRSADRDFQLVERLHRRPARHHRRAAAR